MTPFDGPALEIPAAWRAAVAAMRGEHTPGGAREVELVRLPTCDAQLIVHVTPGGAAKASVAGPSTTAKYRRIVPGPFYVQLVLRPEAARSVLGAPLHTLADRVVDLEDLWGAPARALIERAVMRRAAPQAAVRAIEGELARRIGDRTRRADLARLAADRLRAAPATSLARLAAELGASERGLRQAFLDHIGVSPKRFARIARVRRVVAAAGTARWAQLAAAHDFYDQAHLNAEFRALLGVTPGQLVAGELPFTRPAA
ncbi:MAG TPA: helix-turn-helix domain-containing protein [Kofleriaceae bacterium]|nr:helix-turn-helix domain-containing protein [Kofleriaceae bacterium]